MARNKVEKAVDKIGRDKYEAWAEQKLKDLGIADPRKRYMLDTLIQRRRQRYISHDLDTVVRLLKKELRDGEGFNYGAGSVQVHRCQAISITQRHSE